MVDPLFSPLGSKQQMEQHRQQNQIIEPTQFNNSIKDQGEDEIEEFIPELFQLGVEPPRDDEHVRLLSNFVGINDLVIKNKTSEPRDFLMTERTTLAWVKFSTTLLVSAIAITLNYRFDTSTIDDDSGEKDNNNQNIRYIGDKFKYGISILFSLLSIGCVLLGAYNYFHSIFNYKRERIDTYDVRTTFLILFLIIIILLIANIILMIYD